MVNLTQTRDSLRDGVQTSELGALAARDLTLQGQRTGGLNALSSKVSQPRPIYLTNQPVSGAHCTFQPTVRIPVEGLYRRSLSGHATIAQTCAPELVGSRSLRNSFHVKEALK